MKACIFYPRYLVKLNEIICKAIEGDKSEKHTDWKRV